MNTHWCEYYKFDFMLDTLDFVALQSMGIITLNDTTVSTVGGLADEIIVG